jgi:excisionase family DNA binding protein
MSAYLDIRELAEHLRVRRSTLYAWVAQDKIPYFKIHGLIRFRRDEIEQWLDSFRAKRHPVSKRLEEPSRSEGLDALIARVKRDVYTAGRGETRPRSSLIGKEETDGAV